MNSRSESLVGSRQLPGDFAVWLFILAELSVFALLFILFAVTRARYPEMFSAGKANIDTSAGLWNTIALLSSSYFVALAQLSLRQNKRLAVVISLLSALICAAAYLLIKGFEYQHLQSLGFGLDSNDFYFFYFGLTGFHMLHVVLGMLVLLFIAFGVWRGKYHSRRMNEFESGACYWHMVDLLWLMLFPLVYVLKV